MWVSPEYIWLIYLFVLHLCISVNALKLYHRRSSYKDTPFLITDEIVSLGVPNNSHNVVVLLFTLDVCLTSHQSKVPEFCWLYSTSWLLVNNHRFFWRSSGISGILFNCFLPWRVASLLMFYITFKYW